MVLYLLFYKSFIVYLFFICLSPTLEQFWLSMVAYKEVVFCHTGTHVNITSNSAFIFWVEDFYYIGVECLVCFV